METQLRANRGVSPVIAVILMVAITVILAAVVGSFVLDVGSELENDPPATQWEVEEGTVPSITSHLNTMSREVINVNLTYIGGETIRPNEIAVTINGDMAIASDTPEYFPRHTSNNDANLPFDGDERKNNPLSIGDTSVILFAGERDKVADPNDNLDVKINADGSNNLAYVTQNGGPTLEYDYGNEYLHEINQGDVLRVIHKPTDSVLFTHEIREPQ